MAGLREAISVSRGEARDLAARLKESEFSRAKLVHTLEAWKERARLLGGDCVSVEGLPPEAKGVVEAVAQ